MPIIFLFAFGFGGTVIVRGGPGLWAYALVLSAFAAFLMAAFTSKNVEPSLYKYLIPYIAFTVGFVRRKLF